ncbi:MAG: methylenetetrahydrofolate reductase C-terminal domain-containing protein [Thermococcus sp.]|uniref:methylenetetrahydrofolate reductase C-terminal domain-containing protein n=1 Tax=Thermococcus sp. TaxID=35749 RepID=UPI001D79078C|nr:methylenetetrahydrofolate reductase C-terminal domain-containing protein [Thermococcus sp.]MBO8175523.1 methylenetetrahydrofolate reductase C-terminal domain-containing protein [Thermococcus sp.]
MIRLRVSRCPKALLNGPCGGAFNEKCEVTGNPCPWLKILEGIHYLDGATFFNEHPLLMEIEKIPSREVKPKHSNFWSRVEKGKALSIEFPIAAIRNEVEIAEVITKTNSNLYTIPDNPLGCPHFSSTAFATYLKHFGIEVMPHLTAKDKNLAALTAELKTAVLFNFEVVLLTTGDWPSLTLPSRPVFDLDSANMIRLARLIFNGVLPTKETFEVEERPRVAGTLNPHYRPRVEAQRIARKLTAGVELFFTQVVATKQSVARIKETFIELKKYTNVEVPVMVSLLYPISDNIKLLLRKMAIQTGNDTFEEVLEEVKALDIAGGVNLIVLSRNLDVWLNLWREAYEKIREVFK